MNLTPQIVRIRVLQKHDKVLTCDTLVTQLECDVLFEWLHLTLKNVLKLETLGEGDQSVIFQPHLSRIHQIF